MRHLVKWACTAAHSAAAAAFGSLNRQTCEQTVNVNAVRFSTVQFTVPFVVLTSALVMQSQKRFINLIQINDRQTTDPQNACIDLLYIYILICFLGALHFLEQLARLTYELGFGRGNRSPLWEQSARVRGVRGGVHECMNHLRNSFGWSGPELTFQKGEQTVLGLP